MIKIKQLPQEVISKIAAGEVIERPVFAVKELLENALDANATSITIHIEESGLKKIIVTDNGEGMSKEDLQTSFKPHTTSKLLDIESLQKISTLGFRGEALSSIAAISRMILQSRIQNENIGTEIRLRDGKIEKITPIGMPIGTSVTVDYLFHNLPARKNFLKSKRTEFRQIIDLVMATAIVYPHVHFILTHNNKTIFDLPRVEDVTTRLEKLLGKDIFNALIPLSFQDAYVSFTGFLAKPPITSRTPGKQYLYINNRHIGDKQISQSIKAAYGTMLENNTYPICMLFFTMPYDHVDVNVHPRKEEVKFINQSHLFQKIQESIAKTFAETNLSIANSYWHENGKFSEKTTYSYAGKLLKEKKLPWELIKQINPDTDKVMQLYNLYLSAPTDAGLLLFDQHAVHERILYESFLKAFIEEKSKHDTFIFSKPKLVELSQSESDLLQESLPLLQKIGWEIEVFKDTSFLITAIPTLFQDRDIAALLREMLEDIQTVGETKELDAASHKMIAYLACRGAVKAGDKLTKKQAKDLLEQLAKTPNNATCPHGRPTRVLIDRKKIDALFKRR